MTLRPRLPRNSLPDRILVSGAVDTGVRLNASWERHEHTAVEVPSVAALRAMI